MWLNLIPAAFMIAVLLIVGGIMWNEWRKTMHLKEHYRKRREIFDAEIARIMEKHENDQ